MASQARGVVNRDEGRDRRERPAPFGSDQIFEADRA
jgi:hypothetical protein